MSPDPNSAALMFGEVDPLPASWRALVHEYGLRAVQAAMEETADPDDGERLLIAMRAARQAKWLATDYVSPRSFRNYR